MFQQGFDIVLPLNDFQQYVDEFVMGCRGLVALGLGLKHPGLLLNYIWRSWVHASQTYFQMQPEQDAALHNLFIYTRFRWFLRPSSGAETVYTASGTLSNLYCYLPLSGQVAVKVRQSTRCCIYSFISLWGGGERNRLKHEEHFTEINKLCNATFCWLHLKISYIVVS